jgi:hypothetical protein
MNSVRNVAPPSLPVPPATYTLGFQNVLNSVVQQFGVRTANALNSLLTATTPQTLPYSAVFTFPSDISATYRVNMSGNMTVNPSQTANDGDTIVLWLYAGGSNRTVTLGNIIIPDTITSANSLIIMSGKKAVYTMRYDAVLNGGQWELTAYQNGY